jgi:hypothetical protein
MFFESQRWYLPEERRESNRGVSRRRAEKAHGRKLLGEANPGKPDSVGDIARGMRKLREARFQAPMATNIARAIWSVAEQSGERSVQREKSEAPDPVSEVQPKA